MNDIHGGESELISSKEIVVGKNCFLGCYSIIPKGTVVGDGRVVDTVLSGKFEDNCVIAGNPAGVIQKFS